MVDTSWLMFAGTEIINAARTAAYAGRAGIAVSCSGCAELAASLGDEPYRDPVSDDAPWYDPNVVESKDFHGLVGIEFTGASDGTMDRQVTEYLGDGGVLGASRHASREIGVKALMFASTKAALSYGMSWLATALEGSACAHGCAGDELCVYASCPTRPSLPTDDDDCTGSGIWDPTWDPITGGPNGPGGDQLQRTLYDVGLTEGPSLESETTLSSGYVAEVSFTLAAGNPWWWRRPVTVLTQATPPDYQDVVPGYCVLNTNQCPHPAQCTKACTLGATPCPAPVDCLDANPYCTGSNKPWPDEPFPGSDPNDERLRDPCYPTMAFTAARAMWRIPTKAMPHWQATAPVFEIHAGTLPLHRVTVRWYANPTNRVPTGALDPCDACAEMTIPWIPANTTLTLDSRTRTTTVNCRDQGAVSSSVTVYGPKGGAYNWPAFDCATPLIAELMVLNNSLTPTMTWRVDLASRTGAV